MSEPLYIAFVWHMHQPYYKAGPGGAFELPWVRLHALKDYLDMVETLKDYPLLHQTFNLVPSLVEQLLDYQDPAFRDVYWEHTLLPAEDLTPEQRAFVVDCLCENPTHPRAHRHPRYLELAQKRAEGLKAGLDACAQTFTLQELRDLQIWFTLAWFDPLYLEREPLAGLVARGRDFAESDKQLLADVQQDILTRVVPAYRQASERGQVELTTSPYHHPILPLLINTDSARIARADIALPPHRYAHPEDAAEQVRAGIAHHAQVFGHDPAGMWCSEQAVGEDVITLLADAGIRWTVADEGVLARSLGSEIGRDDAGLVHTPDALYRPYLLEREGRRLAIVFRDRVLSDLVGFTYRSWAPQDAAANLIWRLREIRRVLAGTPDRHVVTIALDGENAWEYYEADGREFLSNLFEGLSSDPGFGCVTISEFLAQAPPTRTLPWLHTGSWVYADLSTWIGGTAHGPAWDLLHEARDTVAAHRDRPAPPPAVAQAWHHIQVCQGSDWFWWFGEHQESGMDHVWDARFRAHLREAYRLVGETPPQELFAPILGGDRTAESHGPTARINPLIDGRLSWPEEWEHAGVCRTPRQGTMRPGDQPTLAEVRYGCDEHHLFLLLVPHGASFAPDTTLAVYVGAPPQALPGTPPGATGDRAPGTRYHGRAQADADLGFDLGWELALTITGPGKVEATLAEAVDGTWSSGQPWKEAALDKVLEVAVPLARLGGDERSRLEFAVTVVRERTLVELLPARGAICLDLSAIADRRRASDG